jgi:hypothetical protein
MGKATPPRTKNKHAHHDDKSNASKNKPKTNVTMVEIAP